MSNQYKGEELNGLGLLAAIAVIVLLLLGGLLFHFNPGNSLRNTVTEQPPQGTGR
jgi:hypothetical protein